MCSSRDPAQSNNGSSPAAHSGLLAPLCLVALLTGCAPAQVDDTSRTPETASGGDDVTADRSGGWRLATTDSPYLRQHADNPVEWHPWGEEAFALAKKLDRPVFLSIGYSSCHWCHVMEHESFEDAETAAYMNAHYVCIKVDREQRPDVDQRYMNAVQAMTGSGGWPLSAWLTTDAKPYYGGTYFPKQARGRMPSFMSMLENLSDAWKNDRQNILDVTARNDPILLQDRLPKAVEFDTDTLLADATRALTASLDPVLGGVRSSRGNRFPPSTLLRFLLRRSLRDGQVDLAPAIVTLDAIAKGGMRDQVGGGFHRYSTDPRWDVPHFEKMLYDNALLACAYAEAYAVTGEARFDRVARDTLGWLLDDMRSPEGLFFSARDADSLPYDENGRPVGDHAEEGDVYLWTPAQLERALGAEDAAHFARLFDVTESGNFERGMSIPRPGRQIDALAADPGDGLPTGEGFVLWLDDVRARLMLVRDQRPQAFRDEKCLTAWNGLALSAFAIAGRLLEEPSFTTTAAELGHALIDELSYRDEKGALQLHHQVFEGRASGRGDLTDHAYLALGALDAYEATGDPVLLGFSWELARALQERFEDPEKGGFLLTEGYDPLLPSRGRRIEDGARPSAQSVALTLLARLRPLDDSGSMTASLDRALLRLGGLAERAPGSLSSLLTALDAWAGPLAEVVLDGVPGEQGYEALLAEARTSFLPAALLVPRATAAARALAELGLVETPALLDGRVGTDGGVAWICREGVCLAPITRPEALEDQWSFVIEP